LNNFGYNSSIDCKNTKDIKAEIATACPDGVNCYFDNTCGPISDAVFDQLSIGSTHNSLWHFIPSRMGAYPAGSSGPETINGQSGSNDRIFVLDYSDRYMEAVE